MFASIADGLRSAAKQPKLVLLLWAWYGLLALIPAVPAWAWWNGVLGTSPEAATILKGFSFGVWGELARSEGVSGMGLLTIATAAVLFLAWISSAFVFGGILEVFGSDGERRSFMHRFYRGGGHFFWRFVRLSLIAGVCLVLATGAVSALVVGATSRLADSEWEPASYLVGGVNALAFAIVAALFLLSLDYARIRVARDDARGMLREYAGGLGFVLRNVLTAYGVAIPFVAMLAALMLCYLAYETNAPAAATWLAIGLLFLIHQAVALGRVFLRVALVGAERRVDMVKRPLPEAISVSVNEPGRAPLAETAGALAEANADATAVGAGETSLELTVPPSDRT
jgi:hypothetical protein